MFNRGPIARAGSPGLHPPALADQPGHTPQRPRPPEVQRQIRASLGLPPLPEGSKTDHPGPKGARWCEFPLWAFSKKTLDRH